MNPIDIILTPRDGLFCKDGRGWFTSSSGRGHALEWPYPSTILGALRSIWGQAREGNEGVRFVGKQWQERTHDLRLGPVLPLRREWGAAWSASHRVWPAPADALLVEGGNVQSLDPRPSTVATIGIDDAPARELLWTASSARAKPMRGPLWWGERSFIDWLCGAREAIALGDIELHRRIQTHVKMSVETGAAEDEDLYSHELVETIERDRQWSLACRLTANDGDHVDIATIGSDRRLASVEPGAASLVEMPKALLAAFAGGSKGLRLYVVSPAAFAGGWLPDGLVAQNGGYTGRLPGFDVELCLRAAFVNRPLAISGWDMANRKPKSTTRAVPPGSVYAFERADGGSFTAEHARALWLAAIGDRTNEGFGIVVPGVWTPPTTKQQSRT